MTATDLRDWNARAAELWPDRWARMETMTGKKRANARRALRIHAETHDKMAALPARAKCGTCAHYSDRACDLRSDFYGVMRVRVDHVCASWKEKAQ